MNRAYYSNSIKDFLYDSPEQILGVMTKAHNFALLGTQRDAWLEQTTQLQSILREFKGAIHFEFSIPRMGKRVDVVTESEYVEKGKKIKVLAVDGIKVLVKEI